VLAESRAFGLKSTQAGRIQIGEKPSCDARAGMLARIFSPLISKGVLVRVPVYGLIVFLAALVAPQIGRHSVRSPVGPMQAGEVFFVDASYDGDPAIPTDYSWKLHVIGATKETFGKGWFTTRAGTALAKEREISLPNPMAALQKAVRKWRYEDFENPGLTPTREIRFTFESSRMSSSSSIAANRDADHGSPMHNDIRDFIWGCLDDLKAADSLRGPIK
jgi:hypothetical protein